MMYTMIEPTIDPAVAALIVCGVALLFAGAAFHKFRDLRRFDGVFAAYGFLSWATRGRVSRLVPVLESGVALGLLFGISRVTAAGIGVLLLLTYAAAIAINLGRGRRDLACGCGGPDDRRPIAPYMVWRNLAIAMLLLALMLPWSTRVLGRTDAVTIGFGTTALALLYLCLDGLSGRAARPATTELASPS
jgi:Methylamine utilisation protein MauE